MKKWLTFCRRLFFRMLFLEYEWLHYMNATSTEVWCQGSSWQYAITVMVMIYLNQWGNISLSPGLNEILYDDVMKWRHFPRYWPFVRGIHRSPLNSPHKSQWRGALMFSLICAWINRWVNNSEAGDLRRYCAHYDVIVMIHGVSISDKHNREIAIGLYCRP